MAGHRSDGLLWLRAHRTQPLRGELAPVDTGAAPRGGREAAACRPRRGAVGRARHDRRPRRERRDRSAPGARYAPPGSRRAGRLAAARLASAEPALKETPEMKHRTTLIAALAAATAVAAPAAADAAKYRGKASGHKITFKQKGKRISKIDTLIYVTCFPSNGSGTDAGFERFNPPGKFKLGKETRRHA